MPVELPPISHSPFVRRRASAVAVGHAHTVVVCADGTVFSWCVDEPLSGLVLLLVPVGVTLETCTPGEETPMANLGWETYAIGTRHKW